MTTTKSAKKGKTKPVAKRIRCPACGKGWLKATRVTDRFLHEEDGVSKPVVVNNVPTEVCSACGEKFQGPDASRLHHEAICRTFGFLTPQEIVHLRENLLELTQEQFAELTGIGQATISRWERGRLVQNRANDKYLRLLKENRQNLLFLKKAAGWATETVSEKKAVRRLDLDEN